MRKLTVKREKTFVASLAKVKVCISDPSGDIVINDVPCRILGTLKNGEEKTFEIEEQAARVYVICDKVSRNICNDYYELPEGSEDISLSGKNQFNPAAGNAFRFDSNDGAGAAENRKRSVKKGVIIFIASILIGFVAGFAVTFIMRSIKKPVEKTFTANGLTIVLTNEFGEVDVPQRTAAFASEKVAVYALRESFELADWLEGLSLSEYGDIVMENNGKPGLQLKTEKGLTYFEYDFNNTAVNEEYRYYTFLYKANDAFWVIQFVTQVSDTDEFFNRIITWASSVSFG